MSAPKVFDILVLGAGPAGTAAALFAARRRLRVALVERRDRPPAGPQIEWLHPGARQVLKSLGLRSADVSVGGLRAVRFVDLQRTESAEVELDEPVSLVLANELTARLWRRAESQVDVFARGFEATEIETAEESVRLSSPDGRSYVGRMLIAGDGAEAGAARRLGIYPETAGRAMGAAAQWSNLAGSTAAAGSKSAACSLTLLFDSPAMNDFAYLLRGEGTTVVGALASGRTQDALDRLGRAVEYGRAGNILPAAFTMSEAQVRCSPSPRGLALDYETHGGKRSLVIGDGGGFVPALGGGGLFAAPVSARLAVEVVAEALDAEHPQDALAAFDGLWRRELVDHLRLPNVDLRFLLPLVFSNRRMAERLARAFFCGENL